MPIVLNIVNFLCVSNQSENYANLFVVFCSSIAFYDYIFSNKSGIYFICYQNTIKNHLIDKIHLTIVHFLNTSPR